MKPAALLSITTLAALAAFTTALAATLGACQRRTPDPPRVDIVTTSTASPWIIARQGSAISTQNGSLWIFVEPVLDADSRRLPGITLGDAKGPRFGLISGYFAPLLALPASDTRTDIKVELGKREARFAFGPDLSINVSPPDRGWIGARVSGRAVVLVRADRTRIEAQLDGRPVRDFAVSAGEDPQATPLNANHLQVGDALAVDARCPTLIVPTKHGSTSVFAIALGPNPNFTDPLFGVPPNAAPRESCAASSTSTVSFRWP